MGVSSVAIQFTIIDLLSKGVDKIRHRMAALAKGNQDVQRSFDRMARSARYAAMAAVVTREMYRGLKPAVAAAGSLQAEMLGTRAELEGQVTSAKELGHQLRKIKSMAFEVQAGMPFDQSQIVALEKELLKAGAKVEQVIGPRGAAAAAASLATYEGLDATEMGKKLIGIATPFKLQADAFMDLADGISRASSASTVGAEEIAETAKYAAPAMAQLGRSTHEMLVLSAVLAQRGMEAGMAGTGLRQFFLAAAKHRVFRDAAGNLKPLEEIIGILKDRLKSLGEAEKLDVLTKIFDVRGAPVALALMEEGEASYKQIEEAMKSSLPLTKKLQIMMEGFNAQWAALKGTGRSTLASLYEPALAPLTYLVAKTNEFVAAIGRAAQGSETLSKVVSGISLSGVAVGGTTAAGLGAAALYYGRKVFKGVGGIKGLMSGLGGTAAGVAAGRAVEAATGVVPVFVTNWPSSMALGGTPLPVPAAGKLGKLGRFLPWLMRGGAAALPFLMSPAGLAILAVGGTAAGLGYLATRDEPAYFRGSNTEALDFMTERYRDQEKTMVQNNVPIVINVDPSLRVTATTQDMNTRIDLRRGKF